MQCVTNAFAHMPDKDIVILTLHNVYMTLIRLYLPETYNIDMVTEISKHLNIHVLH